MRKQILKTALPKLWDDLSLRPYLGEIRRRHGIVETLALPSMRDLPPLRIETLFVSPLLAENPVSADSDPKLWPAGKSLLETLQEHPQLVVLGDPGGGKTTLSNWLAWRLSAGLTTPLPPVLDDRVPLPCVLREMSHTVFTPEITLPELAERIAVRLLGDKADDTLKSSLRMRVDAGSYVLILDGVDEIPVPHRKIVADWVVRAQRQNACVLATSRIVGYEDGPVDRSLPDLAKAAEQLETDISNFTSHMEPSSWSSTLNLEARKLSLEHVQFWSQTQIRWAQLRYLMPFDQSRIAAFAENWYRQRCGTEQEAMQKASDLLASLSQSDVTRQLARTPNLLSLMAIVHRERAHLPDGKALLYDEIANAYINTIDKQRKIEPGDALARYGWKERKAWLAYVGFQMQQLRSNPQDGNNVTDAGVLADEKDVLKWLLNAMKVSGVEQPEQSAQTFLSWVARRSGLLLPRGDKRYAFVHLSFQEYFCACYLDARIASRAFIHNKQQDDDPVTRSKLAAWSKRTVWRETLIYLFELQSSEREADWVEDLAEILFKPTQLYNSQAALAGRVLADRHIRLGEGWKNRLAERCSEQARRDWLLNDSKNNNEMIVLPILLSNGYAAIVSSPSSKVDKTLEKRPPSQIFTSLEEISTKSKLLICLVKNKYINDISPLADLVNLRMLDLGKANVANIAPLARLNNLQYLYLNDTQVADIKPLSQLNNLRKLDLNNTKVTDVEPLASLYNLQELSLNQTKITDLMPLARLNNLRELSLRITQVTDITPLSELINLRKLFLSDTKVSDILHLASLINLEWLVLNDTQVVDITPLTNLRKLQGVFVGGTKVANFTPLAGLINLRTLNLQCPKATDITPLAGLKNLEWLHLKDTKVADVAPLAGLSSLQSLDISNTKVTDVTPLAGLNNLEMLYLQDTQGVDVAPLAGLKHLEIDVKNPLEKKQAKPREKLKSL